MQTDTQILLDAISHNKMHLARFVLDAVDGAIVDSRSAGPQTPLIAAVFLQDSQSRRRFTSLLLHKGASVDGPDASGRTALSHACQSGHLDAVKILVENGGDPEAADARGNTPLMYAVAGGHSDIVGFLVRAFKRLGLRAERQNKEGRSALELAQRLGHSECLRALLRVCGETADVSNASQEPDETTRATGLTRKRSLRFSNRIQSLDSITEYERESDDLLRSCRASPSTSHLAPPSSRAPPLAAHLAPPSSRAPPLAAHLAPPSSRAPPLAPPSSSASPSALPSAPLFSRVPSLAPPSSKAPPLAPPSFSASALPLAFSKVPPLAPPLSKAPSSAPPSPRAPPSALFCSSACSLAPPSSKAPPSVPPSSGALPSTQSCSRAFPLATPSYKASSLAPPSPMAPPSAPPSSRAPPSGPLGVLSKKERSRLDLPCRRFDDRYYQKRCSFPTLVAPDPERRPKPAEVRSLTALSERLFRRFTFPELKKSSRPSQSSGSDSARSQHCHPQVGSKPSIDSISAVTCEFDFHSRAAAHD